MRLYITYNTNTFGVATISSDFEKLSESKFDIKSLDDDDIYELKKDGYIFVKSSYVLDIDYKGTYKGYHKLFKKIIPALKVNIRENLLNELGI